ncbi:SH3 domain-containing protein [Rhodophyticola sp. CCM32]|uniref:SH3 domain-containing protein n=1 Tax=Rhodophyticola sp. CCM32 TaxID=2916397 RepID=UPI00143CCE2A|nr:SH3 domain-containing protein [Rhodophyticola sp. CCM32]
MTPGRVDDDYPGWQWVVSQQGLGGWIPVDLLDGDRITGDFDTTELTVMTGERVTILTTRAGWHWCRAENGQEGWVPADCLSRYSVSR